MKKAVCILIEDYDGNIIAVSRRNSITSFGLPGGKVDPGESHETAICRELFEETGITIRDLSAMVPLYVGPCYGKDGNDFWTTTYFIEMQHCDVPLTLGTREEGIIVLRTDFRTLCSSSPFADYNIEVLRNYNKIYA